MVKGGLGNTNKSRTAKSPLSDKYTNIDQINASKAVKHENVLSPGVLDTLFVLLDTNNNGRLEQDEFMKLMKRQAAIPDPVREKIREMRGIDYAAEQRMCHSSRLRRCFRTFFSRFSRRECARQFFRVQFFVVLFVRIVQPEIGADCFCKWLIALGSGIAQRFYLEAWALSPAPASLAALY